MNYSVKIGGVDYTKHLQIPFQLKKLKDESLDIASIRLYYTDKKEEFEPFTLVEISITDDVTKTFQKYIASDVTEEIISTGKVNHTLVLIEETKEFERLLLTKTTTNPFIKNFFEAQAKVEPIVEKHTSSPAWEITVPNTYLSPLPTGDFHIYSAKDVIGMDSKSIDCSSVDIKVYSPTNDVVASSSGAAFDYKIKKAGQYILKYTAYHYESSQPSTAIFYFNFVPELKQALNKTVTGVVNSLLNTCETIRKGDEPKFKFNKEQEEMYSKVDCPEMSFPKQTLWEALRQIGGVIHAIPRLRGNEVYFDSYDSIVYSEIADKKPISNTGSFDIEQFCSTIESSVDNLIAADNSSEGAIEDYGGYFKTARTEQSQAQITDKNLFIETSLPIGRVLSVEVGYLPDGTFVGDISNYVFERDEYETLSSFDSTYPTSKAYAIYYTLGEKNIKGLAFKEENAFSSVFENHAIENIIRHKLGKDSNWWTNLWENYDLFDMQFKVTYQPYYSATIRQVKPNLKDLKFKSVLSYTQGANSISTQAYGEHLKGVVSRLGTAEKRKVYLLKNLSQVPNVGDRFDKNYVISEVNCEFYNDFITCEIGLSKKFNRWNSFVGVDNELRMYEVSNKQVSERTVIWEDYAIVQKTSEDRERERIQENTFEYPIRSGIWDGDKFVLASGGSLFVGNTNNWTENRDYIFSQMEDFASGILNGTRVTIGYVNRRYEIGVMQYINENGLSETVEIALGAYVSKMTHTGMAIAPVLSDNAQIFTIGQEYGVQYLAIGTSSSEDFRQISWSVQPLDFDVDATWKLVAEEDKLCAISDKGQVKWHRSGIESIDDGILGWSEYTLPITNIIGALKYKSYFLAFNSSKAIIFDYPQTVIQEIEFPTDDIIDFDGRTAISKDKVYYKMHEKWVEYNPNILNMKHIIAGNKNMIILNDSNNVYSLEYKPNESFFTDFGIEIFGHVAMPEWYGGEETAIIAAEVLTYDQEVMMYRYWIPTISSSMGNTFQVQFEFVDNFSAGTIARKNDKRTKIQSYAPYGDYLGEAKYMKVDFLTSTHSITESQENYDGFVKIGDSLPIVDREGLSARPVLSTAGSASLNPILLEKDSREKIKFTYCLHFVSNDEDIIIGSGLAKTNPFAYRYKVDNQPSAKVYILDRKIGDFENVVDLTNAILQQDSVKYEIDSDTKKIRFTGDDITMAADGKAWAIVQQSPYNEEEYLLLFGKNVEFKKGDIGVWKNYEIAFTHNVDEFL